MREKNKGIYQFILDLERKKNRERALREKAEREEFLGPIEQPVAHSQKYLAVLDGFHTEHAGIGDHGMGPLKAGIFEFRRKGRHLEVELGISAMLGAFSLISIIVLLQIDVLVHQNLSSYGFPFILRLITPYCIAINTALGAFWLLVIAAILFQMYVLPHKRQITMETLSTQPKDN